MRHLQPEPNGTCLYVWHLGKERYDEVFWDPRGSSEQDALNLAQRTLRMDPWATLVQVEYGASRVVEAARVLPTAA